ncbi:MAG: hypothetical protein DMF87_18945 [Acidobacteria bacterium]|nr:MAG: hypothetical protein DMF87_18945 [Acidobacteriota bacterium]
MRRQLEEQISGEVRFDAVSRALYSTDASVYQMHPLGVVLAKSREDILRTVNLARAHSVSITARGGGTSQAGQAIGHGLQLDTSKYYNRILELNVPERWAIVEPGIVLDELNAQLKQHGLRFGPDISTASRATRRRTSARSIARSSRPPARATRSRRRAIARCAASRSSARRKSRGAIRRSSAASAATTSTSSSTSRSRSTSRRSSSAPKGRSR